MATYDISSTNTQSVNLSYSRDAYIPTAVVVGDRIDIETTLFTDTTSFTANIGLVEKWTGTTTEALKRTDGTTTDIYSRYSVEADNSNWTDADNIGAYENPPHKEYREFSLQTLEYSGGSQSSATAWIEISSGTWERTGETAGLNARVSVNKIPYIKFQAGDRGKEYTYRGKNKAYTGIVKGASRLLVTSGDFSEEEFIPFTVDTTDRFKAHNIYEAYRINPSDSTLASKPANGFRRTDEAEAIAYAQNIVSNNTVPTVEGTIVFTGSFLYIGIGEFIDSLLTKDGKKVDIGLSVVDVSDSVNAIKGGGTPTDSMTWRLGRV